MERVEDFWSNTTSVFFTSFWRWDPATWGTVGFTKDRGKTRRSNLLKELSDPFITVCYITGNQTYTDPKLKGMIAGFYLVSHETGDRDEFTHPIHHGRDQEKWRHSLRALRAFSYLPEHRLSVRELDPALLKRALSIAGMGEMLTDPAQIALLKKTPWVEVDVYTPSAQAPKIDDPLPSQGQVRAGPASKDGYVVSAGTQQLQRELYILRLDGDTEAYLGKPANGRSIYKIGFSVSPDLRRQFFQKSMPRGAFQWSIYRTSTQSDFERHFSFDAAVTGENEMKNYLAKNAEWLGGEFYLATDSQINTAWQEGNLTAKDFKK